MSQLLWAHVQKRTFSIPVDKKKFVESNETYLFFVCFHNFNSLSLHFPHLQTRKPVFRDHQQWT